MKPSFLLLLALLGAVSGQWLNNRPHYFGSSVQDSAETVAQKFLARMTRSIESKDTSIINGLFQPGFIFKGRKGTYNNQQIVALLSKIPVGTKFTFTLKSAQDTGASIKYTVSATGFGASAIEADFILNKVDQQLESGVVPACQKSPFLGFADGERVYFGLAQGSNEAIVQNFLARLGSVVQSRNRWEAEKLFVPLFLFKECNGQKYNKERTVNTITDQWPPVNKFTFQPKSIEDLGLYIRYIGTGVAFDAQKTIDVEFLLEKSNQQLVLALQTGCQSNVIGRNSGRIQKDEVAEKFLKIVAMYIRSGDWDLIGTLIMDGFDFRGCYHNRKDYNKQEFINEAKNMLTCSEPVFTVTEVLDFGHSPRMRFAVRVTGFGSTSVNANFLLNLNTQTIYNGFNPDCRMRPGGIVGFSATQNSSLIGDSLPQTEDPNTVILRFLASVKPILASMDTSKIGTIFDDAFILKACPETTTYTKEDVIEMILLIEDETKIKIDLEFSKWNDQKQIEFIVNVNVPMTNGAFQAQFVYCPVTNTLKSGFVTNCPPQRK